MAPDSIASISRTARCPNRQRLSRTALLAASFLAFACLTGCSDSAPVEPPEVPNSERTANARRPITEVRQSLNISANDLLNALAGAFRRRDVPYRVAADGNVESEWIPARDSLCTFLRDEGAPLRCRVRVIAQVEAISPISSAVSLRYEELCDLNGDVRLECPDSSGERLILALISDIQAAASR